ncbi:MAG: hypothetical protein ACRC1Z_12875 [Waterburya sp.]
MINTLDLKTKLKKVKSVKKIYNRSKDIYQKIKLISWQKSELKYFILVTNGRSGSTCLLDLLDSHPNILTDPHTFYDCNNLPDNLIEIKTVYSSKNVMGIKFRTKIWDYSSNEVTLVRNKLQQLLAQDVSIIYLQRHNILKRAISKVVTQSKLKEYKLNLSEQERKCIDLNSIEIDLEELEKELEICQQQEDYNQKIIQGIDCLKLVYEEDLEDSTKHQQALDKVCSYLHLESAIANTKFVKISPSRIDNFVSNYDALVSTLKDTDYEKYLD